MTFPFGIANIYLYFLSWQKKNSNLEQVVLKSHFVFAPEHLAANPQEFHYGDLYQQFCLLYKIDTASKYGIAMLGKGMERNSVLYLPVIIF